MKIALLGATGNVRSRILDELLSRGHWVTAIVRHPDKLLAKPNLTAVIGDEDDPDNLASTLRGHDPSDSLYSLTLVKDSATRYVLIQQFESWETQLAHQSYDYVLAAMAAIEVCLAGPASVELLDVIL